MRVPCHCCRSLQGLVRLDGVTSVPQYASLVACAGGRPAAWAPFFGPSLRASQTALTPRTMRPSLAPAPAPTHREGWTGSYVGTVFHPTRWDRWAAWYYGGWKWRIRPWERRLRRWRKKLAGWRRR